MVRVDRFGQNPVFSLFYKVLEQAGLSQSVLTRLVRAAPASVLP